jgi:hypothetical protein
MQALRLASTFQYILDYHLIALELPAPGPPNNVADVPLLREPLIDVDKFFVKVPTSTLLHISPSYSAKPVFTYINSKFADNYTLQIASEPVIVSVPLSSVHKANLIRSLLEVADVCCYPSSDNRLITSRQCILGSQKFVDS